MIGAVPTSFIFARIFKGIDIREHGSGNVGATNVFRVVGKLPGVAALIIDILKGAVAIYLASAMLFLQSDHIFEIDNYRVLFGFLAICGHIWTPFLRFKGGKGIATTIGVLAIISQKLVFWYIVIWLAVFLVTRYVSLASVTSSVILPLLAVFFNLSIAYVLFTISVCIITTYRHNENINRLIKGIEPRTKVFGARRSK